MWTVALTGFVLGIVLGWMFRSRLATERNREAVKLLENAMETIFERRPLNEEEYNNLLLDAVACGCRLEHFLDRSISLYVNGKMYPPGVPFRQFGMKMGYLYPYLPTARQLLGEDWQNADLIYRFKDGRYDKSLLDSFCDLFDAMGLEKGGYTLLCIPGSDPYRTERRYWEFMCELSDRMEWRNGYGYLSLKPHPPVHLRGARRMLTSDDLHVEWDHLANSRIVLLDDLLTSGRTVLSVCLELRRCGVRPVAAVFVGRTVERH